MRLNLDLIARPFVSFSERYYPDPFVFAIGLTGVTFMMAVVLTPTTAAEALSLWGNGLTNFLGFAMQICIVLVGAHALAHTDLVRRGIDAIARLPRSGPEAYGFVEHRKYLDALLDYLGVEDDAIPAGPGRRR